VPASRLRVPVLLAALVVVIVLAGCSPQVNPPDTTTTTTSTTSTTTTTTMPTAVTGTALLRARVAALPRGALALPLVTEGSTAWMRMVPIAYRSFGSGPDLLLISGQDGTLSWWGQTLLSDLSGHYRVTVFDLPGAGYSGNATAALSLSWLADITAGLVVTIGLSDPTVLGWGLGGQIALSLVERHPGLASALVLVDTAAGGAGSVKPSEDVAALLGRPGATPVALSAVLFPPTVAGLEERSIWPSSLLAGPSDWMTARAVRAEAAVQAVIWRTSALRKGLGKVIIPALVVSGTDDIVFPPANSTQLAEDLPHSSEVSFPSAGYGAIIQDEPAFVAAVENFSGSNSSGTTTTSTSTTSTTTTSTTP
jgi:pimeloyl-ACP methyl ester carboxylesterase